MSRHTEEMIVKECKASEFADCDIIFSGLDADVAGDIGKIQLRCFGARLTGWWNRDGVSEG
jgi:hypothetical protein